MMFILVSLVWLVVGLYVGGRLGMLGSPRARPKAQTAHIVLDLETLGTVPGSVVTNIGAAVVYPHKEGAERWGPTFYCRIDRVSAENFGLQVDPETEAWWMKQTPEARAEAFEGVRTPLVTALADFRRFVQQFGPDVQVWGNGSDFDCAILAVAYHAIGQKTPWKFWNARCLRTLRAMHKDVYVERSAGLLPHHAKDDAVHQAEILLALANKGVVG